MSSSQVVFLSHLVSTLHLFFQALCVTYLFKSWMNLCDLNIFSENIRHPVDTVMWRVFVCIWSFILSNGPAVSLHPLTHLCLKWFGLEVLVEIHVTGDTAIYREEKKSFFLESSDRVSCTLYFLFFPITDFFSDTGWRKHKIGWIYGVFSTLININLGRLYVKQVPTFRPGWDNSAV